MECAFCESKAKFKCSNCPDILFCGKDACLLEHGECSKKPWFLLEDAKKAALSNMDYRRVLYTTPDTQMVAMRLRSEQEIGLEQHPDVTQFFFIEKGSCYAQVGLEKNNLTREELRPGSVLVVPRGVWHNVTAGLVGCALLTLYSPPEHPVGLVQEEKP